MNKTDKAVKFPNREYHGRSIDAALNRTHAKLEFARLERQELADIRQQRDKYKAHADKLAEALRDIMAEFAESDNDAPHLKVYAKAKQALSAYESEVR